MSADRDTCKPIRRVMDLLTEEEQAQLRADLRAIAAARRRGEAEAASTIIGDAP